MRWALVAAPVGDDLPVPNLDAWKEPPSGSSTPGVRQKGEGVSSSTNSEKRYQRERRTLAKGSSAVVVTCGRGGSASLPFSHGRLPSSRSKTPPCPASQVRESNGGTPATRVGARTPLTPNRIRAATPGEAASRTTPLQSRTAWDRSSTSPMVRYGNSVAGGSLPSRAVGPTHTDAPVTTDHFFSSAGTNGSGPPSQEPRSVTPPPNVAAAVLRLPFSSGPMSGGQTPVRVRETTPILRDQAGSRNCTPLPNAVVGDATQLRNSRQSPRSPLVTAQTSRTSTRQLLLDSVVEPFTVGSPRAALLFAVRPLNLAAQLPPDTESPTKGSVNLPSVRERVAAWPPSFPAPLMPLELADAVLESTRHACLGPDDTGEVGRLRPGELDLDAGTSASRTLSSRAPDGRAVPQPDLSELGSTSPVVAATSPDTPSHGRTSPIASAFRADTPSRGSTSPIASAFRDTLSLPTTPQRRGRVPDGRATPQRDPSASGNTSPSITASFGLPSPEPLVEGGRSEPSEPVIASTSGPGAQDANRLPDPRRAGSATVAIGSSLGAAAASLEDALAAITASAAASGIVAGDAGGKTHATMELAERLADELRLLDQARCWRRHMQDRLTLEEDKLQQEVDSFNVRGDIVALKTRLLEAVESSSSLGESDADVAAEQERLQKQITSTLWNRLAKSEAELSALTELNQRLSDEIFVFNADNHGTSKAAVSSAVARREQAAMWELRGLLLGSPPSGLDSIAAAAAAIDVAKKDRVGGAGPVTRSGSLSISGATNGVSAKRGGARPDGVIGGSPDKAASKAGAAPSATDRVADRGVATGKAKAGARVTASQAAVGSTTRPLARQSPLSNSPGTPTPQPSTRSMSTTSVKGGGGDAAVPRAQSDLRQALPGSRAGPSAQGTHTLVRLRPSSASLPPGPAGNSTPQAPPPRRILVDGRSPPSRPVRSQRPPMPGPPGAAGTGPSSAFTTPVATPAGSIELKAWSSRAAGSDTATAIHPSSAAAGRPGGVAQGRGRGPRQQALSAPQKLQGEDSGQATRACSFIDDITPAISAYL